MKQSCETDQATKTPITTLYLRFESSQPLPRAGDCILMQGWAGLYQIRIRHVLVCREEGDGATVLKVQATRHLCREDQL